MLSRFCTVAGLQGCVVRLVDLAVVRHGLLKAEQNAFTMLKHVLAACSNKNKNFNKLNIFTINFKSTDYLNY